MAGKGNASALGGQPGDLLLKVLVKPHEFFKRDGADIKVDKYITVTQAILGANVKVATLSGETSIVVNPGTADGQKMTLAQHGVSKLPPNQGSKGDQIITFKIAIPNKLTDV